MKKKHWLAIVTLSGEECKLGYLSQSTNKYVLGTPRVEGVNTSHLTIVSEGDTLSSHITPQEGYEKRQFFPELNLKEFAKGLKERIDTDLISPLSDDQLSQDVMYVTKKFENWLRFMSDTVFEKRTTPKEIMHILNLKKFSKKTLPLIEELRNAPETFLGLCKAKDILDDDSKSYGLTSSRTVIIPIANESYSLNFSLISNFVPTIGQKRISNPLSEIYRSLGIHQYMEKIKKQKIIERLLSKCANT